MYPLMCSDMSDRIVTVDQARAALIILAQMWAEWADRSRVESGHRQRVEAWSEEIFAVIFSHTPHLLTGSHHAGWLLSRPPALGREWNNQRSTARIPEAIRGVAALLCAPTSTRPMDHAHLRSVIDRIVADAIWLFAEELRLQALSTPMEVSMWSTGVAASERDAADTREAVLMTWFHGWTHGYPATWSTPCP